MKIWLPSIRTQSGSDVFVIRLIEALTPLGIDAQVQWLPHYYELCPYLLRHIKPPSDTDLIVANSWAAIAFANHDIPLVTIVHHCVHDPLYSPYKSFLQMLYHKTLIYFYESQSLKKSTAVVSVSQYTASVIKNVFACESTVIYNAIDVDKFNIQPKPNQTPHPFKLLFVGNTSTRKGFDLLPKIMDLLGDDFKLCFTSGLRNQAVQHIKNAECLGQPNDEELVAIYNGCDALLFPSRYEGFGYVVAEAMACGLPVVTSRCSALTELVEHGKGGFLCTVDDAAAFADAVKQLADNAKLRETMRAYNRTKAEQEFTLQRMAKQYKALFDDVLAQRGKAG